MSRRRSSHAFTLIEVMVAVSIVAVVSTLVWSSFRQTTLTKKNVEAQSLRYRTVRIALDRIAREMAMAFLSQNEDTGQAERRTRFVGRRRGALDELQFSYFGHQRLYEDASEGDTALVSYFSEPDRDRRGVINLMRRESRRLQYVKPEDLTGQLDILCDDVTRFKLEYWDARDKAWREEWSTLSADGQPDRLPSKVRITLAVRDERGKEVPFQTQTRIHMQEPLNLRAADVQNPAATTPGPGAKTDGKSGTGTGTSPASTPAATKTGASR